MSFGTDGFIGSPQTLSCLDYASIHLVRITLDGSVSDASSSAAAALRSTSMKSVVGENFINLWVTEKDRTRVKLELTEMIRETRSSKIVNAMLCLPSGHWNAILFMSVLRSDEGSVNGFLMVLQDFNELASFMSSSLSRVSNKPGQARTSKTEGTLKSAASLVMHELRSPLHGITGLANALSESEAKLQKPLKMISNCAVRELENVTKLMDYWTLVEDPTDSLAQVNQEHDIAKTAREVLDRCSLAVDKNGKPIQKKNVEFLHTIDTKLVRIPWDQYFVTQLLYHLVSNAFKFTATGNVKLIISNDSQEEGIHIVVEDTGIGIASENTSRVFEPWQQEDDSVSRKYEGIGLGLAIVKKIVQKCYGSINVDSHQGKGSTFSVWLPSNPCEPNNKNGAHRIIDFGSEQVSLMPSGESSPLHGTFPEQPAPHREGTVTAKPTFLAPAVSAPTLGAKAGGATAAPAISAVAPVEEPPVAKVAGLEIKADWLETAKKVQDSINQQYTVMSVDDDPVNQEVICQTLERCGFKVIMCMSGFEALQWMEQEPTSVPDIILLDLRMPGINGFDVLKAQRQKYGEGIMPIVMVSADVRVNSVVQGFELGANDWVQKPFENAELVARVHAHLRFKDLASRYCKNYHKLEKVKGYVSLISSLIAEI